MAIKDLIFQGIGNSSIPFLIRRGLSAPAVADLEPSVAYTTENETRERFYEAGTRGRSYTATTDRKRFFSTSSEGARR